MADRLTYEERCAAVSVLDWIAQGLNEAAGRFEDAGADAVAAMVDRAARELGCAC